MTRFPLHLQLLACRLRCPPGFSDNRDAGQQSVLIAGAFDNERVCHARQTAN